MAGSWRSVQAMWSHQSQLEWYRMLYICFSRYMTINSYRIEPWLSQRSNFEAKFESKSSIFHNTSLQDQFASHLPFVPFFLQKCFNEKKMRITFLEILGQMRYDSCEWIWRKVFPSKTDLQIASETVLQRYQVWQFFKCNYIFDSRVTITTFFQLPKQF